MMATFDDLDAYGNRLPKATRSQLSKELALWNRMRREMQRLVDDQR